MVTQTGLVGENAVQHAEEEFRNGQEPAPILLRLEVGQVALSKTWDQRRGKDNVTHKIVVCFIQNVICHSICFLSHNHFVISCSMLVIEFSCFPL